MCQKIAYLFIGSLLKKNNMDSFPANVNVETSLKMDVTTPHYVGNPGSSRRGYRRARGRGGQKNEKQRERAVKNVSINNGLDNKVGFRFRGPEKLPIDNTKKSAADHLDSRKDLKHTATSAQSDALNSFHQNMQVTTDTVVQESKNALYLSVTESQHCTPVSLNKSSNALWH